MKRPLSGPMKEWNGVRDSSALFTGAPEAPMRVRRTWTGSSARICKCDGYVRLSYNRKLTRTYSDSQNPELAAKQILAIAPILDGQKDNRQFQIPPHVPKKEKEGKTAPSASDPVDAKNTGSDTGSGASEAPQPSSEGNNSVERKDSRTSEVDEYVDAEEK